MTSENRTKSRKPGTFAKGDPRFNRTKPGPGRPPLAWTEALSKHEPEAIQALAEGVSVNKSERLRYPGLAGRAGTE